MKKLPLIFAVIFSVILTFCGCKEQNSLDKYVSELRSDYFISQNSQFNLKGGYGFIEAHRENDGEVDKKIHLLSLRLLGVEDQNVTYHASLDYQDKEYKATFKLNPVTHAMTAVMEIENFTLKEFTVKITSASDSHEITMRSALPDRTIDYHTALKILNEKQSELIKSYFDQNGNFLAEICARVIVKDQKPYWYIGLSDKSGNLKALLIDGLSGEVLAVREVL